MSSQALDDTPLSGFHKRLALDTTGGPFLDGYILSASSLVTEFMPRRHRGPMLSGLVCMFFTGAVAAYVVGNALSAVGPDGWRWMLLSSAVPAALLLVLRLGTPESPRWLLVALVVLNRTGRRPMVIWGNGVRRPVPAICGFEHDLGCMAWTTRA